jgi:hypothetical protein
VFGFQALLFLLAASLALRTGAPGIRVQAAVA